MASLTIKWRKGKDGKPVSFIDPRSLAAIEREQERCAPLEAAVRKALKGQGVDDERQEAKG